MWQGQDGKVNPCDCQKSMMGEDGKKMWQGQDSKEKLCDCLKSIRGEDSKKMWQGQDGKVNPCDCQKSMMGEDCKKMDHRHIKSMMGDKGKKGNDEIKIVIINVNT